MIAARRAHDCSGRGQAHSHKGLWRPPPLRRRHRRACRRAQRALAQRGRRCVCVCVCVRARARAEGSGGCSGHGLGGVPGASQCVWAAQSHPRQWAEGDLRVLSARGTHHVCIARSADRARSRDINHRARGSQWHLDCKHGVPPSSQCAVCAHAARGMCAVGGSHTRAHHHCRHTVCVARTEHVHGVAVLPAHARHGHARVRGTQGSRAPTVAPAGAWQRARPCVRQWCVGVCRCIRLCVARGSVCMRWDSPALSLSPHGSSRGARKGGSPSCSMLWSRQCVVPRAC